jgi:hypothetical protein
MGDAGTLDPLNVLAQARSPLLKPPRVRQGKADLHVADSLAIPFTTEPPLRRRDDRLERIADLAAC